METEGKTGVGRKILSTVFQPKNLRRSLKVSFYGAVSWACYQYYTPKDLKQSISDKAYEVVVPEFVKSFAKKNGELELVFNNDESLDILGGTAEGGYKASEYIFDNWFAVMGRHDLFLQNPDNRRAFKKWLGQFDDLKGESVADKAKGVDAIVDKQIGYQYDHHTYGRPEYWASPLETIDKGYGDCEDFAILKYYALRYLGVPADRLYVTAVGAEGQDLNHGTLLVNVRESSSFLALKEGVGSLFGVAADAQYVIFDNDGSVNGKAIEEKDSRFRPYYAMNEDGLWAVPQDSKLSW